MKHKFDTTIAGQLGLPAAIIFEDINYWIQKNADKKLHFHEDKFWTFCSQQAFAERFPYLSSWDIRQGLKLLQENEFIIKSNFNKNKQDRTIWYALGPRFKSNCEIHNCNCQNPQMQLSKSTNAPKSNCEIHKCICEIHEPLPNNRPLIFNNNRECDNINIYKPPTLEDIKNFAKENKAMFLAEKFFKYYSVTGWKDKRGEFVNWKQKFLTWLNFENNQTSQENFQGREYSREEINGYFDDIDSIEVN